MMLNKWSIILSSLTIFIYCQIGNSLTEFLRNEHLVVAGNDSDGFAKLWITPKLFASTIVVPIGPNRSISSAFTEQSSRNRELLVESSYINNTTSLHHIFVPLENGVLNVTFMYNVTAAQDNETVTVVQPHKLYRFGNPCPPMCASLGVYKIRDSLYTLCASPSRVCRCKLSQTNQQHSTILLSTRQCRLLSYPNSDVIVQQISDVVDYAPTRIGLHLLFALNRHIYRDDLIHGTDVMPIYFSNNLNCQIVLRLQIVKSKLLIYCANNTMLEYDFNTEYLSQFNNHLYFPCSETANFSVNLTNNELSADIHYYRMDNISHQFSPLQARQFMLGECIAYKGHHLFLYTDRGNNLHLINSSMLAPNNFSTSNQYARPLIIGERYVVTHNLSHQTTSVFDLQDIRTPIITQQDMPYQLATVISNLSTVIEIEPCTTSTPSSIVTLSPTSSYSIAVTRSIAPSKSTVMPTVVTHSMTTSPIFEPEPVIWPPIAIAIAVIILCLSIGGSIGAVCYCRRQRSKSPPPIIATSPSGRYEQDVLPTGSGIAISNLCRETDSHVSTIQLQSSRNTSGSEIRAPATPISGSLLDGSSRCSSVSPLFHSQGYESSCLQETEFDVILCEPIEETNIDEGVSNIAQQVVPGSSGCSFHSEILVSTLVGESSGIIHQTTCKDALMASNQREISSREPDIVNADEVEASSTQCLISDRTANEFTFGDIHGPHTERVHQTCYFSAAKSRGKVLFLYHHLLECNSDGIEYTVENHDVTLRVPEGTVYRGKNIHFEIGVAMYGNQFIFPENSQPISPIVWLCLLEEDVELKKPFELVLPHYLIGLTDDQLQNHHLGFIKASHDSYLTDFEHDKVKYKFNESDIIDIQSYFISTESKGYGVLKSTHCCYLCIKANKAPKLLKDTSYCLARIESLLINNEVYFIASYFLKTCIEAWKEQFSWDHYKITRCKNFKFSGEMTTRQAIEIVPRHYQQDLCELVLEPRKAEIVASDIDFWSKDLESMELKHEMKMYPPRVKMTVLMKTSDHVKLSIDVIGCSSNLDMDLVLHKGYPLTSPTSSPSSCGSLMANYSQEIFTKDDKPELKDLFRQLYPLADHWENIGCLLGIKQHALKRIKKDEENVHDRLQEMLSEYLKQVDPLPTWKNIIDTVDIIDSSKAKEMNANLAHIQRLGCIT